MQFKIERKQRFFQLAVEGLLVGQEEIFGELLCDRAGALGKMKAVADADNESTDDTARINAVVLIKTGILNRDGFPEPRSASVPGCRQHRR